MSNWQEQLDPAYYEEWEADASQVFMDPETGEYFIYELEAYTPTEVVEPSSDPLTFEFEIPALDLRLVLRAILVVAALLAAFLWCLTGGGIIPSSLNFVETGAASQPGVQGDSQPVNQEGEDYLELPPVGQECAVSERFPSKVLQWCAQITHYANKRGLDPNLVAAVVWLESGGNPLAYSKSGAVGLMQVMPRDGLAASFNCVNGPCFSDRPRISELQDPEFNLNYGTKMLAGLLRNHGNLRDALKSYGPMDVGYYYADKVMGIFQRYGQP